MYSDRALYSTPAHIPPGSYVNPAFARPAATQGTGMSNASAPDEQLQSRPSQPRQPGQVPAPASGSLAFADAHTGSGGSYGGGSKRKLDSFQGAQSRPQTRESRVSAQVQHKRSSETLTRLRETSSPVLPSRVDPVRAPAAKTQQPKNYNENVLGLTPGNLDPHYTSSESDCEDDSLDEEAMLAHGLGPNLTFHDSNGEMRTLNTVADLMAWRSARRANFPTRDRLSQKHAEKRQIGLERKRLLTEASEAIRFAMCAELSSNRPSPSLRTQASVQSTRSKLDSSEPHVDRNAESSSVDGALSHNKTASESNNLAAQSLQPRPSIFIPDPAIEAAGAESTHGKRIADERRLDAHLASSNEHGRLDASQVEHETIPTGNNDASDPDSSEDPPEETTFKQHNAAKTMNTPCKYFVASGYCRDGSTCRFKHELPKRVGLEHKRKVDLQKSDPFAPALDETGYDSRKSIHRRLLERDRDDQDQLALQVIKYLGSKQFFSNGQRSR